VIAQYISSLATTFDLHGNTRLARLALLMFFPWPSSTLFPPNFLPHFGLRAILPVPGTNYSLEPVMVGRRKQRAHKSVRSRVEPSWEGHT